MIRIYFILLCLFLISCGTNTLEIISTGEKVEMNVSPYVKGDTIILWSSSLFPEWRLDENWTHLTDTTVCNYPTDSLLVCLKYRQAVVLE